MPAAERFKPDIILVRCLCSCRQLASDGLPTVPWSCNTVTAPINRLQYSVSCLHMVMTVRNAW